MVSKWNSAKGKTKICEITNIESVCLPPDLRAELSAKNGQSKRTQTFTNMHTPWFHSWTKYIRLRRAEFFREKVQCIAGSQPRNRRIHVILAKNKESTESQTNRSNTPLVLYFCHLSRLDGNIRGDSGEAVSEKERGRIDIPTSSAWNLPTYYTVRW
jgi:hypothetical protein